MSKNTKQNLLKPSEVNKRIIAKSRKTRSSQDWVDHLGKYREEHVAEYNKKKNEFLNVAAAYNKANRDTLTSPKTMLHNNYEEMLNLDFLKEKERSEEEECDPFCCCLKSTPNTTGKLLRKRSLRSVSTTDGPKQDVCLVQPWFKRYLTLNKFIFAARTIIIQNRLLKVLQKLRGLTREEINELESCEIQKRCEDFHCHPVFLKFL
ncbi:uncharacterized protein LOC109537136 [Dendroctonus ponderosae]|uniref:Uncharacterized protein n=1 Tax=Dendroctonus ponderosae TaxID=77166 RepID=A0AAR5PE09_DENPD|nr:uncharacterized protein LOC109537136 [Dendroctonus ponderosae]KAH1018654.1 hypothetical protein HUJ05_006383 [Dendroctonus ponderosae]